MSRVAKKKKKTRLGVVMHTISANKKAREDDANHRAAWATWWAQGPFGYRARFWLRQLQDETNMKAICGSSTFVCVVQLVSFFFFFPKRDITPRMQNFEDIFIFGNSSSFCAKRCVSILIWMQQERMLGGRPWDHHPLTGWAPLGNCCIFLHLIWKGCFGVLCFQSE